MKLRTRFYRYGLLEPFRKLSAPTGAGTDKLSKERMKIWTLDMHTYFVLISKKNTFSLLNNDNVEKEICVAFPEELTWCESFLLINQKSIRVSWHKGRKRIHKFTTVKWITLFFFNTGSIKYQVVRFREKRF